MKAFYNIVLVPVVLCAFTATKSQAAPVTLAFEAEIGPPNTVSPYDVPFPLSVQFDEGDVVVGRLTIEPNANALQRIELDINGSNLTTTQSRITIANDVFTTDTDIVQHDEIRISCSPLSGQANSCMPNSVPGDDEALWGLEMYLFGFTDVLNNKIVPADPDVWNSFLSRNLSMSFREASGPGIVRLYATVDNFQVIPEPASLTVLVTMILGLTGLRRKGVA